jgi:hypothetical protein
MVSVLALSVVDHVFEPQIKDYKIGICRFSAKHAAIKRKNKNWLVRNQNNVSKIKVKSVAYLPTTFYSQDC